MTSVKVDLQILKAASEIISNTTSLPERDLSCCSPEL